MSAVALGCIHDRATPIALSQFATNAHFGVAGGKQKAGSSRFGKAGTVSAGPLCCMHNRAMPIPFYRLSMNALLVAAGGGARRVELAVGELTFPAMEVQFLL